MTPSEAATAYDGVQPNVVSAAANGPAAASAPSCPSRPVSWVTIGVRRGENQSATSRSTEMNTIASPMPSSTRHARAAGYESMNAKASCAAVMSVSPTASSRFEPKRSSSAPTGSCIAA